MPGTPAEKTPMPHRQRPLCTHLPLFRGPRVALALTLLCGLVLGPASIVRAGTADDDYALASKLYKAENWKTAEDAFKAFLRDHAQDSRASVSQVYLGIVLAKQNKQREAHRYLLDYARQNPKGKYLADALYRAGRASFLLEDYAAAEKEYAAFLSRFNPHPFRKYALLDFADSQAKLMKTDAAVRSYQAFLRDYPKDRYVTSAKYGLAKAYGTLGKPTDAAPLYADVIKNGTETQQQNALWNLAELEFARKNYAKAEEYYAGFAQKYPDATRSNEATLNTGYALYQQGDYTDALPKFQAVEDDAELGDTAKYWAGLTLRSLLRHDQAVVTFQALRKPNLDADLTPGVLYYLADSQLRIGNAQEAQKNFLTVADEHSDSELADDALLNAGESALQAGDIDEADKLITRFAQDYPESPLRLYHQMQQGRLKVQQGGEQNLNAALTLFRDVLQTSRIPQTQAKARYQIASVQQQLDRHEEALRTIAPNLDALDEAGQLAPGVEAYALAASSALELKSYAATVRYATRYLDWRPDGPLADQASAALALAHRLQGNRVDALAAWEAMQKEHDGSPLFPAVTVKLADLAYAGEDWDDAATYFQALVDMGTNFRKHDVGQSGLAWTRFRQGQHQQAAELFAKLLADHPASPLVPESAQMVGRSYQEAGDQDAAVIAYEAAFDLLKPEKAVDDDPNTTTAPPEVRNGYLSGLQAARMNANLDNAPKTNALYEAVADLYPELSNHDALLDEWALFNYERGDFDVSDKIFRRLIQEHPNSGLADDAKLSLAESLLINGQTKQAGKLLDELLADPQSSDGVKEVATFHRVGLSVQEKDWDAVVKAANAFTSAYPKSEYRPEVLYHLGDASLMLNKLSDAKTALESVYQTENAEIREQPWFGRVPVLLAEVAFKQKEYDTVDQLATQVRTSDPKSPWLYQLDEILGRSFKQQSKFDDARTAFQRVIAHPNGRGTETAAKSQFLIAETYLLDKNHQQAVLEYLKVDAVYPFPEWQAPALFQAGRSQTTLGAHSDAVKTFDRLINTFPESEYSSQAKPLRAEAAGKADTTPTPEPMPAADPEPTPIPGAEDTPEVPTPADTETPTPATDAADSPTI